MRLETLKGVKKLGGFEVVVMDDLRRDYPEMFNESGQMDYKKFEAEIRPHKFIYVRHDVGSISFTIQSDPVGEVGVNGCQTESIIEAAKTILEGLNKKVPSRETSVAITKLDEALMWLEKRTKDRVARGVEGTNEK